MFKKSMMALFMFFIFIQFYGERTKASDFYSYIPFLYIVPEGSVGIFKNGNQYYDDVYPAGVYTVWPSDEGVNISIAPEKIVVTNISCIIDGEKITLPGITVHYQVHEADVFNLVKKYGVSFVNPLIKKIVKQGVADFCNTMVAETIHLEDFSILKQFVIDYLVKEQNDKDTGLSIGEIVINHPRIPDGFFQNHVGHVPNSENQIPTVCEQPYEIFYMLEDEQEARSRLCGFNHQLVGAGSDITPEGDLTSDVEPHGMFTERTLSDGPNSSRETNREIALRSDGELSRAERTGQLTVDSLIDGPDAYGEFVVPLEKNTGAVIGSEPLGGVEPETAVSQGQPAGAVIGSEPLGGVEPETAVSQGQPAGAVIGSEPLGGVEPETAVSQGQPAGAVIGSEPLGGVEPETAVSQGQPAGAVIGSEPLGGVEPETAVSQGQPAGAVIGSEPLGGVEPETAVSQGQPAGAVIGSEPLGGVEPETAVSQGQPAGAVIGSEPLGGVEPETAVSQGQPAGAVIGSEPLGGVEPETAVSQGQPAGAVIGSEPSGGVEPETAVSQGQPERPKREWLVRCWKKEREWLVQCWKKEKLHQQVQGSKGLWKNSQMYLGW